MKQCRLSEEIFEVISNEESHYKQRSFQRRIYKIRQDDKNTLFCRTFILINKNYYKEFCYNLFICFLLNTSPSRYLN